MLLPLMDTQGPTINWTLTGSLPSGMTFSRASAGTYFDADGALQSATNNVPRFDHDPVTHEPLGLLMEGQRQNVFLNSDTPATQNISVTAQVYTLSFYGTGSIALSGTHTATVTGTGAYPSRKTYSFTPTAGTLTLTVSGDVQKGQLEAGSAASSYIPTAGTAVTRAQDTLYTTNIPWFNPTQGTFVVEVDWASSNLTYGGWVIWFDDGSPTNYIAHNITASGVSGVISYPSNYHALIDSGAISSGDNIKIAPRYKSGNNKLAVNGVFNADSSGFYTSGLPSGISRLIFGNSWNFGAPMSGHIKSFKYWNTAKPDAFLQRITQ